MPSMRRPPNLPIARALRSLVLRLSLWRERLDLAELPPERLRDLGLSRADAIRESRKGFSAPGARRRAWENGPSASGDGSARPEPRRLLRKPHPVGSIIWSET